MMELIYQVYQACYQLAQQRSTPIHLFRECSTAATSLFISLQKENSTISGVLSGVLLDFFCTCKIKFPAGVDFSSSFYIPGNILKYSKLCASADKSSYIDVASSFNCFDAWVLKCSTRSYVDICVSHCATTPFIDEILQFVKIQLQDKNIKLATEVLENGGRFNSPVIYRLLSRMYLLSSPSLSLIYSKKAIELGDIESKKILASLVDNPCIPQSIICGQISNNRLLIISHLLSRLDPLFVKKVQNFPEVQCLKFGTFIAGNHLFMLIPPHPRYSSWSLSAS